MELEFSIFREADLNYAITMSEFSEYIDVTKKEIKETTKKSSGGTKKTSDGDDGDTVLPVENIVCRFTEPGGFPHLSAKPENPGPAGGIPVSIM